MPGWQSATSGGVEGSNANLLEQCSGIEGVSTRVGEQSGRPSARESTELERAGHFDEIGSGEPLEPDPGDSRVAGHEPRPARIDESIRAGGDDGQDRIGPQSAKCEQQRPRGRSVDPLQIIDDKDDYVAVGLETIEQVHQPLADDHRIGTGLGQGIGLKLIDDPIGEQGLGLVGAHLENRTSGD